MSDAPPPTHPWNRSLAAVASGSAVPWVCSQLPSAAAWAVGPGAATFVYLTLAAVQLAAAEARAAALLASGR